ncbi:B-box type zinc finger family protein [Euphorbia peplus]|nr:B-box type zinc finger family protein [Euphorbia peplus]
MFCESDQASLCWDCDSKVHAANFLVAKHSRTLLCNLCQSFTPWTASGPNLTPTASVCNNCIAGSSCRDEIRNGHRRNSDDDDNDDDHDDRDEDDDDGDSSDDDSGDGYGGGDEDDEENQVVPWSSSAPPPSSSSNSDRESYSYSNSDEISSFATVSVNFKSSSSVFQKNMDFVKKNKKKAQISQERKKNRIWKQRRAS